ncbi:MAG: DNA-formamidopyrimidine glycosylase family protein [Vicinamibacterales bacterium]
MPELPDVVIYCEALQSRIVGRVLKHVRVVNPFVLRTFDPPIDTLDDHVVRGISRAGKRIVIAFDDDLFLVIHLMIAGRLRWRDPGQKPGIGSKMILATLEFENGTLLFTEAGTKRRASLHVVRGEAAVRAMDRGGIDLFRSTRDQFEQALVSENHTLKRSLTDPRLFSGIGNAYSDELLHAARLSPLKLTRALSGDEIDRLFEAARRTLDTWIARLRTETGGAFPEKVTAFHDAMAVHGRFGKPCPVCGAPVQRIVYAENECNYCAICQTEGRLLADRALSRLLRDAWPKRLDEW